MIILVFLFFSSFYFLFFFFFSSRRRHTRLQGDWSSDVCSSDLILDLMLPGIDGYEVVRRLHTYPKTIHIPIVVLSSLGEPKDKVSAFETGVDDYITKPFHTDELIARIHAQLRRVQQNFLSPLIGLPGGFQVELAIKHKLNSKEPWSLLYLDLDNFKAFNDAYGFLTGNDMIRLVGRICQRVVREFGNPDDFVGHVGGDDFV